MFLAVLAALAIAAPAEAAKTRVAVGKTSLTGVNSLGTAQANCPRGTVAVSGGFGQTPPADLGAGRYVNVFDSHRQGSRAWKVTGVQFGSATTTLTAYAYCRVEKKPKQIVKTFPLLAPARYEATAVATCPGGRRPISGGFRIPQPVVNGSSTFLTDAEIFGKHQWVVTGVRSSTSATADGTVTAYAYCAKGKRPKAKLQTTSAQTAITPRAPFSSDTAPCSKGRPISGGLRAPYTQIGGNRGVPVVTDSLLIGGAWRVAALPFGGADGIPVSLTAIVYCR